MNLKNLVYYGILLFCINNVEVLAIFANGKCPNLDISNLQSIDSVMKCENYNNLGQNNNLMNLAYAFIPTSYQYKRTSVLSFNFTDHDNPDRKFGFLSGEITCFPDANKEKEYFLLRFKYERQPFLGFHYFKNDLPFLSFFHKKSHESCKDWLQLPDYKYQLIYHPAKYFLLWQCVQVNESMYDRALLLMGPSVVSNVSTLFAEMLIETNLKKHGSSIWNDVLWSNVIKDSYVANFDYDKNGKQVYFDRNYFRNCYKNIDIEAEQIKVYQDITKNYVSDTTKVVSLQNKFDVEKDHKIIGFSMALIIFLFLFLCFIGFK